MPPQSKEADCRDTLGPVIELQMLVPLLAVGLLATPEAVVTSRVPATVAFDLSGLEAELFAQLDGLSLERVVMVRVVQEGFAVVRPDQNPAVLIRLVHDANILVQQASGPFGQAESRTRLRGQANEDVHLELAQKAVDLVRITSEPPTVADTPPQPESASAKGTGAAPAAQVDSPISFELELHGGVGPRGSTVDPAFTLLARARLSESWSVECLGVATWSQEIAIDVREGVASCGVGYSVLRLGEFFLDAAVLLGAYFHQFALRDQTLSNPSGTRSELIAFVRLAGTYWVLANFGLNIQVVPGFSAHGYAHHELGRLLWRREPWWLVAGVGVAARW